MSYVIKHVVRWEEPPRDEYFISTSGANETWGGIENAMRFSTYVEAREFRNTRIFKCRGISIVDETGPLILSNEERIIEVRAIIERTKIPTGELADLQRELQEIGAHEEADTMGKIVQFLEAWRDK